MSNGSSESQAGLIAAYPLNECEELAGTAKVEHHFGAQRIVDCDIDQSPARRDIAQAHWIAVMREVDFALPDQAGDASRRGCRDPLRPARSASSVGVSASKLDSLVGEAALDHLEEQGRTFRRLTVDLRFVRELQAKSIALDPANSGIRGRVLRRSLSSTMSHSRGTKPQRIMAPPRDRFTNSTSCDLPS